MISRYFSENNFKRLQIDFAFLFPIIRSFKGELDFSMRKDYFNLYFRGNSAAKVSFLKNGKYRYEINKKFFPSNIENDDRFIHTHSNHNEIIVTSSKLLHPLLQKRNLDETYSKIKKENYSEEVIFEQMLMTDNASRCDLILIDRQVTDSDFKRKKIDLLTLKQKQGNKFQFMVLEIKMGNNPELKEDVAHQLNIYQTHITNHFEEYKFCYEKNFSQKKILGLMENPPMDEIEIVKDVEGMIVVGGYSGPAKEKIQILVENHPEIIIQSFFYKLNIS